MKASSFKELEKAYPKKRYIWWLNIGIENLWDNEKESILPQMANKSNLGVVNRTEQICAMLADSEDILILREPLPDIVVDSMKGLGQKLPTILNPKSFEGDDNLTISELILRDNDLMEKLKSFGAENIEIKTFLVPYAVTHIEEEISMQTGCPILGPTSDIASWVNSKVNSRIFAQDIGFPVTEGYICKNVLEVKEAIFKLRESGVNKIAIKEAYGASGKGFFILESEKSFEFFMNLLSKKKNETKKINVIVEKWHNTIMDINFQVYISLDGTINYIPPKAQIIEAGIYTGSEFPINNYLSDTQIDYYEKAAFRIGEELYKKGYRGIASIDSIIIEDGTIIPIIEINGRFTLSTYVSFIPLLFDEQKRYKTKYFNLQDVKLEDVWHRLSQYSFSLESGEGIIIYSNAVGDKGSRVFMLLISKEVNELKALEVKINDILAN